MAGESASLESASHEVHSHTKGAMDFTCRKRLFALTLEQDAFSSWKLVHQYMCARKKPGYALVCEHDGPEYPHIHALYQYDNVKLFSTKSLPLGVHVEEHVFSPQKYVAYCKAEDEKHKALGVNSRIIIEEGELKQAGGCRSVKALREANIEDVNPMLYRIKKELDEKQREEDEWERIIQDVWDDTLAKTKFIYVHGPPGNGKTYGSIKWCKGKYERGDIGRCSIIDGFFSFIKPHAKVMLVPEFKDDCCKPSQFLTFTDKYGDQTNIKHGDVWTHFEVIIVCSAVLPQNLWPNSKDVNRDELIRRIDEFYEVDANHEWHKREWYPLTGEWV